MYNIGYPKYIIMPVYVYTFVGIAFNYIYDLS